MKNMSASEEGLIGIYIYMRMEITIKWDSKLSRTVEQTSYRWSCLGFRKQKDWHNKLQHFCWELYLTRSPWRQHPASLQGNPTGRLEAMMPSGMQKMGFSHYWTTPVLRTSRSIDTEHYLHGNSQNKSHWFCHQFFKSEADINSCFCSYVMPSVSRICSRC